MEDEAVADHRHAYVYVNSDGKEEMYYSACESPLTSDDETSTDIKVWATNHCMTSLSSVTQPIQNQRRSKRSKKKAHHLARLVKVEFFQPLCDLVEDQLLVEVGRLEVSSCA